MSLPVKLFGRYTSLQIGIGERFIAGPGEQEVFWPNNIHGKVYFDPDLDPVPNEYTAYPLPEDLPEHIRDQIYVPGFRIVAGKWDINDPQIRGLDVQFEVKQPAGTSPDTATIRVYNLSKEITWKTAVGNPVVLRSGYVLHNDIIFAGYVKRVETEYEGNNVATVFQCIDRTHEILNIKRTWMHTRYGDYNTSWSDRIIKTMTDLGVPVGYVHPTPCAMINVTRIGTKECVRGPKRGLTGNPDIKEVTLKSRLDKIVSLLKSMSDTWRTVDGEVYELEDHPERNYFTYFFKGGRFYFVPTTLGWMSNYELNKRSGLLDVTAAKSFEVVGEGEIAYQVDLQVKTMLIPRVTVNSIIYVVHRKLPGGEGYFRVTELTHRSSSVAHVTEMKVTPQPGVTTHDFVDSIVIIDPGGISILDG